MELIDILKERKMTREQLSNYLGVDDRKARRVIEALRKQGNLIVNDGDGYTVAKNKLEAADFLAEYYRHFKSMANTLEIMMKEYEKLED